MGGGKGSEGVGWNGMEMEWRGEGRGGGEGREEVDGDLLEWKAQGRVESVGEGSLSGVQASMERNMGGIGEYLILIHY